MDVEVVADDVPATGLGISSHDGLHMRQKIFLRSCRSRVRCQDLSSDHVTTEDEAAGSMTLIRRHRVVRLFHRSEAIRDACARWPERRLVHRYSPFVPLVCSMW